MNQQRSRRFRAAKEAEEKKQKEEEIRRAEGLPPAEQDGNIEFDTNCITPGTEFMFKVAEGLKYYTAHRMSTDPGWKGVSLRCVFLT